MTTKRQMASMLRRDLEVENWKLREQVRVLTEALRPFAAVWLASEWPDELRLSSFRAEITAGDIRRAAAPHEHEHEHAAQATPDATEGVLE